MRRFLVASAVVIAAGVAAPSADAVPLHLHCLTNGSGTHSIGRGVTANAPHDTAFHNLHFNVHVDVFMAGKNPHTLAAISPTGTC